MSDIKKPLSYRDLLVWQKSIALVLEIYTLTAACPAEEKFGLVTQMRRAAISIPSNIAEGQARHTTSEFIRFIAYAEGSVAELDTQCIIAEKLLSASSQTFLEINVALQEIRRLLNALRRSLNSKQ